jgi:hypothetical protein
VTTTLAFGNLITAPDNNASLAHAGKLTGFATNIFSIFTAFNLAGFGLYKDIRLSFFSC